MNLNCLKKFEENNEANETNKDVLICCFASPKLISMKHEITVNERCSFDLRLTKLLLIK